MIAFLSGSFCDLYDVKSILECGRPQVHHRSHFPEFRFGGHVAGGVHLVEFMRKTPGIEWARKRTFLGCYHTMRICRSDHCIPILRLDGPPWFGLFVCPFARRWRNQADGESKCITFLAQRLGCSATEFCLVKWCHCAAVLNFFFLIPMPDNSNIFGEPVTF